MVRVLNCSDRKRIYSRVYSRVGSAGTVVSECSIERKQIDATPYQVGSSYPTNWVKGTVNERKSRYSLYLSGKCLVW